jgi:phosphoribosylamine--glycine ligase
MAERGSPFAGLLYAGLVLTHDGPKVIEFNCRFGDPETQVVLELLDTPLGRLLAAAAAGDLTSVGPLTWRGAAAVTVVIAAENYPGTPVVGDVITGAELDGVLHAGTKVAADGSVVSAGGRVLSVIATGADLTHARSAAYALVDQIQLRGSQHRTDIAEAAAEGRVLVPGTA